MSDPQDILLQIPCIEKTGWGDPIDSENDSSWAVFLISLTRSLGAKILQDLFSQDAKHKEELHAF